MAEFFKAELIITFFFHLLHKNKNFSFNKFSLNQNLGKFRFQSIYREREREKKKCPEVQHFCLFFLLHIRATVSFKN